MDFVAIDFEVANMWNRASACAIGIVKYKDGIIVDEYYSLINPNDNFDPFCISIHNITPEMVEDKPTFDELWESIKHFFNKSTIIAHNASFDMSVLRHCLNEYNISYPECDYVCTYLLGKRIYPGLASYKLNYLIDYLELASFNHHQALDDAKAAADIIMNYIEKVQITSFSELAEQHRYRLGKIIPVENTYRPFSTKRDYRGLKRKTLNAKDIITTNTEFDEDHPFYEKMFSFTGTLTSMSRADAMQKVVDCGGICGNGVTMKTNYLVIGVQDYSILKDGKKSSKMKRAEKLASDGQEIEIITEDDFLQSFL